MQPPDGASPPSRLSTSGSLTAGFFAYVALAISSTVRREGAIALTILAFALCWLAAFRFSQNPRSHAASNPTSNPPNPPNTPTHPLNLRLLYGALSVLAASTAIVQPMYPALSLYRWAYRLFGALSVLLIGVHAAAPARWRRRTLFIAITAGALLWLVTPHVIPRPIIDVWQLHQAGINNLLHGKNPYSTPAPDIYEGRFSYGYSIDVYDYLPLNLLLSRPGWALFGDYRYGLCAAFIGTIFLLRAAARTLQVSPRLTDLLTFALILHPRLPRLLINGWTEPFMFLSLAAFVYLYARAPKSLLSPIAFLMMPALKQYVAVPTLLYLALRPRWKGVAIGGAIALCTLIPFLIWDSHATIEYGVLFVLRRIPFRPDSISIPALLYPLTGMGVGKAPAVIAQFLAGGLAYWLLRSRGLAGFLLSSTIAVFASFLFGGQAFLNYYFFVGVFLLFAMLVMAAPQQSISTPDSDRAEP